MNRLQRKLMPMQNTLYLIPTAKRETYPISISGLTDKDIHRLLSPQAVKKPRLASVLPLLEFFAWTLMSEDNRVKRTVFLSLNVHLFHSINKFLSPSVW
ncbi:hypothetical protein DPEC_G00096230 [Dallia pectoralis]|uniref:Uncharacterized protein n=1 Tax=Dallia pectoralis TaxID=75939 RepID=A0ACC2GVF6_DALPE|nr:hypothetical protein DPEC_G00096230 [Dallia pectoralis]